MIKGVVKMRQLKFSNAFDVNDLGFKKSKITFVPTVCRSIRSKESIMIMLIVTSIAKM